MRRAAAAPRRGRAGPAPLAAAAVRRWAPPPPTATTPERRRRRCELRLPPAGSRADRALPRTGERALLEFSALLLFENLRYWAEAALCRGLAVQAHVGGPEDDSCWSSRACVSTPTASRPTGPTPTPAPFYYHIGRANNLGVKESFLLAAFESLYWEAVVEWREVFSVNDTIVTDFGALSIGEPWYQLSRYLTHPAEPGGARPRVHQPACWACTRCSTPPRAPAPPRARPSPGTGSSSRSAPRPPTRAIPPTPAASLSVGLRSRLALAPGYTAPGTESRQGWEVLSSTFNLNVDLDGGTARELDVSSGAVFYGRLERSVGEDSRGSASILGLGSAFTLFRKEPVTDYDAGQVRVRMGRRPAPRGTPGLPRQVRDHSPLRAGVRGVLARRGARASPGRVEAYPDFGLVNAYALNAYSADHDIAGVKTTLLYYGYYYGYGASLKARLEAGAGPVTFGTAASAALPRVDRGSRSLRGRAHRRRARLGHLVPVRRQARRARYPGRPVPWRRRHGGPSRRGTHRRHDRGGDGVPVLPRGHLPPVSGCRADLGRRFSGLRRPRLTKYPRRKVLRTSVSASSR